MPEYAKYPCHFCGAIHPSNEMVRRELEQKITGWTFRKDGSSQHGYSVPQVAWMCELCFRDYEERMRIPRLRERWTKIIICTIFGSFVFLAVFAEIAKFFRRN